MPTKKRITVPGSIAHVMARGISGIDIFHDDSDRREFLCLLSRAISQNGYQCYAWVLMSNHYHLLMRCSENPLDKPMRQLNAQYAKYYNRKNKRTGYVFQGRFKSIITQDQFYLEELIRYVHLNPIRAGICKTMSDLDQYPWCGHSALIGKRNHAFQTTEVVMRRFGSNIEKARKRYREFLQEGLYRIDDAWLHAIVRKSNQEVEKKDKPECWVIGDRKFVSDVLIKNENRIRVIRSARENWPIDKVADSMIKEWGISIEELKKHSRSSHASECKKKFAYICCSVLHIPVSEVAQYLGVSSPAVSWEIRNAKGKIQRKDLAKFTILPPG